MNMKINSFLLVVLLSMAASCSAIASMTRNCPIEIVHDRPVSFTLAGGAVNRISFGNFRVMKLIGNLSNFDSVLSDNGVHLFITPKIPEGSIYFAGLLSNGKIIDFSLEVARGKVPELVELRLLQHGRARKESEELKLMKAMRLDITNKYYVQQVSQKVELIPGSGIRIEAKKLYRWQDLYGISLVLRNTGRLEKQFNADDLALHFQNVALINVEAPSLKPGKETNAYVVLKKERAQ